MFINDYPLSLYDEDTAFTSESSGKPGRSLDEDEEKEYEYFRRYLRLVSNN